MVKRVDISLAVSKKSESDESGPINYTGGFIGESGKYYTFECNWRYIWIYEEMRFRALDHVFTYNDYDMIDKCAYKQSNGEIIYKESIFINE